MSAYHMTVVGSDGARRIQINPGSKNAAIAFILSTRKRNVSYVILYEDNGWQVYPRRTFKSFLGDYTIGPPEMTFPTEGQAVTYAALLAK